MLWVWLTRVVFRALDAYRSRKRIGIISRIISRRDVRHGTDEWAITHTRTSSSWYVVFHAFACPVGGGIAIDARLSHTVGLQGQTDDQCWAWARRHTFHSWREHYKMNSQMMDVRIDNYLQQLENVGHHLGHDLRRHDHWNLGQEQREEEEEEEEDGEEEEQERGLERQGSERPQQVRPAAAERHPERAARDYLARYGQDLVTFDEEEGDGIQEDVAIQEPQRVKRHRVHPDAHRQCDIREAQAKRARVSDASTNERRASGVEASHSEGSPTHEEGTGQEESEEVEGSDLFGDRTYEHEPCFDFDDEYAFVPYNCWFSELMDSF